MKKLFTIICMILMVVFLAGCSQEASGPKPEDPNEQANQTNQTNQTDQPDVSPMVETLAGVEVVLDDYDFVAVKDYAGKYLDKLEKKEINIGGGSSTYTVAIFGEAQDLEFVTGEYQTGGGGDAKEIANKISNTLLTFTNAPGGKPNVYCGLWINQNRYKIQLAPNDEFAKKYALIAVKDGNEIELGTETQAQTENEPENIAPDNGRMELGTYAGGNGFELLIEEDKTKEVTKGVPVHYLSMVYTNGQKRLLVQSVDRDEDWTNSIAAIHYPTVSNDGTKVYYSTDNTFNRSSGYGANNYRTRVVDLNTFEDSYFEEGALVTILNSSHGPYADHIVLELNSLDSAGKPTMVYQVVTPGGEQLVVLEESGDWQSQVDAKLNQSSSSQQTPEQSTSPNQAPTKTTSVELYTFEMDSNGVDEKSLQESIHGYNVEYPRYYCVVIQNYPAETGKYPFRYGMSFENPAYSNNNTPYNIAVAGTIHNVKFRTKSDMNAAYTEYKVADTIEDAYIEVLSSFPADSSVDEITFQDFSGKTYRIPFTEMNEENKVYAIKLPF
ncbi:MAG: hypothetical protein APF84_03405 [Gracilibacter sp. BRH_c7a]|nr:MAG: hypothetical protein APF84_03405 [Gracilibacter sp. BRH_c7a]